MGRSVQRDIEIKLKAVSAEHCQIYYQPQSGWVITEKHNQKSSSNGTFVFMKSHSQIEDHEPSDMIRLYNGMVISFINYELQVIIEEKNQEELAQDAEYFSQAQSKQQDEPTSNYQTQQNEEE